MMNNKNNSSSTLPTTRIRRPNTTTTNNIYNLSDSTKARLFLLAACIWPLAIFALFASSSSSPSNNNASGINNNNIKNTNIIKQLPQVGKDVVKNILDRVDVLGYGPTHPRIGVALVGSDLKLISKSVESIIKNTDLNRLFVICIVVDNPTITEGSSEAKLFESKLNTYDKGAIPHWHGNIPDKHASSTTDSVESHSKKIHVIFSENEGEKRRGISASRAEAVAFINILSKTHEKAGLKSQQEDLILLLLKEGSLLSNHNWIKPITSALIVPPPILPLESSESDKLVALKLANAISFETISTSSRNNNNNNKQKHRISFKDYKFAKTTTSEIPSSDLNLSNGLSYKTPILDGNGATAMRLETYLSLPAQDLSLSGQYETDLDLSMNLWLCGDGIDILDGVSVMTSTSNSNNENESLSTEQAARFASVWMNDKYAKQVYNAYEDVDRTNWDILVSTAKSKSSFPGDGLQNKCRSFDWYVKEVNTDLPPLSKLVKKKKTKKKKEAAIQKVEEEEEEEQDDDDKKEDEEEEEKDDDDDANNETEEEENDQDKDNDEKDEAEVEKEEEEGEEEEVDHEGPKQEDEDKDGKEEEEEGGGEKDEDEDEEEEDEPDVNVIPQFHDNHDNNNNNKKKSNNNNKSKLKLPSKELDPKRLEIISAAMPVDISYVDVTGGHKEHPHRGAKDEDGNYGYVHDEKALRNNPPPFQFDKLKRGCSNHDAHYKMLTQKVYVDLDEHNKKEQNATIKRDTIFCLVYTTEKGHDAIPPIRETWGPKCDGFMVGSTKTNKTLGTVEIPHEGPEEYNNIWQKVRSMWSYIYDNYYEKYDWFHIGGDDLWLIVENLRLYLESEEIQVASNGGVYLPDGTEKEQTPLFLGRRFAYMGDMDNIFCSGGSGYTMNKAALKTLVVDGFPNYFPHLKTFSEDTMVAKIFRKMGVFPYDTKDETGGERYMPFLPGHHYNYRPPSDPSKDWYAKYSIDIKFGLDHCAARSVAFHYVKPGNVMKRLHAILYHLCPDDPKAKVKN